ncbi:MAG: phosphatidylcholine/phosphatidylserine synthase [Phycisphaeraceae bacterium]|nr:phosphatidylcholine/phosphatidylserine synthase [Phycisphaeraceae bacterium]
MFLRLGHKRTEVPLAALIPNLLTTLALCSGLASLHFSLKQDWDKAVMAIGMSMIFDTLDGRAARLLRVSSRFGAVLDSLSDFLAFGIAPAMILHQWLLHEDGVGRFELAAVMTYALCAGLRLARFTAAAQGGPAVVKPGAGSYFVGMPTPAAAGAVLIPAMLELSKSIHGWKMPQWSITVFTLVIAVLMISRVPTFSFKKITVQRKLVAPLLVLVGLFVTAMISDFWLTLAILAGLNVLLIPVAWVQRARTRGAEPAEPAPADEATPADGTP